MKGGCPPYFHPPLGPSTSASQQYTTYYHEGYQGTPAAMVVTPLLTQPVDTGGDYYVGNLAGPSPMLSAYNVQEAQVANGSDQELDLSCLTNWFSFSNPEVGFDDPSVQSAMPEITDPDLDYPEAYDELESVQP